MCGWLSRSRKAVSGCSPFTPEIALRAYEWPADFHGDPADRLIAATASVHHLTLVTSDEKLLVRTELKTLSTR